MMMTRILITAVLTTVLFATAGCGSKQQNDSNPSTNTDRLSQDEGMIAVNGTELYYRAMGEGEPIVIVHGGPMLDHSYLLPYLKPLADTYRLIFYDQRLSGRSTADVDTSSIRLANFVGDLEALRRELDLGDFHLMGHSWGGLIAMNYAIEHHEHLSSMILLNSMPATAKEWREEEEALAESLPKLYQERRKEIMESELMERNRPAAIKQLLRLSFQQQMVNPALAADLEFEIPEDYSVRSQKFGHIMQDLEGYDLREELVALPTPTLLIYGSIEPAVTLSAETLKLTLPDNRLEIIEDAGHFPFVEQPEAFKEVVRRFLKEK